MTDQRGDRDIRPSQQTDITERTVVSEGNLLLESNDDLAAKQHEQPAAELCNQAASEVCVIKQKDSTVQHELGVPSLQSTASEISGNVLPCVSPVTPVSQGNLNAVKSSEVSTSQKCDITSAAPALVTGDQEMEVSVSAQLEMLSFKRSQLKYQETEYAQDQHFGQENNFPQVDVTFQDNAADVEDSEGDESSSSENSSSDSDSDSTSSSSSALSVVVLSDGDDDDQELAGKRKPQPVKTKDELLLEDLPKVEEVNIVLPEEVKKEPIGIVSSIIDQLVIVKSLKDMPPVNEETILFRKDNTSVGKVFEVFGPVSQPFYILRFNSAEDVTVKEIKLQQMFYFAPAVKDFTQYIFTEQLKQEKGSDASWRNDQEPPAEALDFSDDEKEREAKQKKKKKQQNHGDKNTRSGGKEDGQAQQQKQVHSVCGRGFKCSPGHEFRHQSSTRFESPQPPENFGTSFNQRSPFRPPGFHPSINMLRSQPVMSNPLMSWPFTPPFWTPMPNDMHHFLTPPPPPPPPPPPSSLPLQPMSTGWSESNMRHTTCFPNAPPTCFSNTPPPHTSNSQHHPQGSRDFVYRSGY
ncbi:H/ACA ribonucleoprotein complex non-core subunit NAF1 [Rhincodon typus]|uniref:H/ACA ribonucleoprotein complex non-core subunit NAF1 n=1 Tax=Rhincodon typus TaxID=259920 RepID=UPI002030E0B1|nr:H/ACA ribonucleoprotein complex non-core subunit NAF1 [Rhincodon typus]XP_048476116.1 H/ACA ribonucleoprotein complex non-core subunit NAF1 [Rhincodon typus]